MHFKMIDHLYYECLYISPDPFALFLVKNLCSRTSILVDFYCEAEEF